MSTGELIKQYELSAAFNLNTIRVLICAMRKLGLSEITISAEEIANLPDCAAMSCEEAINFETGQHGVHVWHNMPVEASHD